MATNFTFTRENAEQMVAKVQAQADAMKTAFDALAAAAENIKSSWVGDGVEAFIATYNDLQVNYNNLSTIFSEGCTAAKTAAALYEEGDTEAASTLTNVDTAPGQTPISFAG